MADIQNELWRLYNRESGKFLKFTKGDQKMGLVDMQYASRETSAMLMQKYRLALCHTASRIFKGKRESIIDQFVMVNSDGMEQDVTDLICIAKNYAVFKIMYWKHGRAIQVIGRDLLDEVMNLPMCLIRGNVLTHTIKASYSQALPPILEKRFFPHFNVSTHLVVFESEDEMLMFKMAHSSDFEVTMDFCQEMKSDYQKIREIVRLVRQVNKKELIDVV